MSSTRSNFASYLVQRVVLQSALLIGTVIFLGLILILSMMRLMLLGW